jgi:hypothetical protein
LGGRSLLLTCRWCNNRSGYLFEGEAKARLEYELQANAFFGERDGDFGPWVLEKGGIRANVYVTRENGVTCLRLCNRHNDPANLKRLRDEFDGFGKDSEFCLTTGKGYRERPAAIADLKAAYLLCVAKFGYRFASRETLRVVREQIINPADEIFRTRYFYGSDLPESTIIVIEELGLVALRLGRRVVVMPWPSRSIDAFSHTVEKLGRSSLTGRGFRFPKDFEAILDHHVVRNDHRA